MTWLFFENATFVNKIKVKKIIHDPELNQNNLK